jgi:hypothetical protein
MSAPGTGEQASLAALAPAVEVEGALAGGETSDKPPPVLVIIDAKNQVTIAAADSWADLATWKLSAGPKPATREEEAWKRLKEARSLGQTSRVAVDTWGQPNEVDRVIAEDRPVPSGPTDDPPPPEEADQPVTGGAMALEEGKMGKDKPRPALDPAAREFRRIAGRRGRGGAFAALADPTQRLASVAGEVSRDHKPDREALVIALVAPANDAKILIDVITETEGMIGVVYKNAIRPLRVHFSSDRNANVETEVDRVEVRIDAKGLVLEGVPAAPAALPWTTGPLDAKALRGGARGSAQGPGDGSARARRRAGRAGHHRAAVDRCRRRARHRRRPHDRARHRTRVG